MNSSTGQAFTPHILHIGVGEEEVDAIFVNTILTGIQQKNLEIVSISTCGNLTLVLLWVIMAILVFYYIKHMNSEIQVFEPFKILGLEPRASDSEIKKAYMRLSI